MKVLERETQFQSEPVASWITTYSIPYLLLFETTKPI
jgi:hypothetical protein